MAKNGRNRKRGLLVKESRRPTHQQLLKADASYRARVGEKCEAADPVDMLWHLMQQWDKRAIKRRKRFYPADLVDALCFYGARAILGKGLADLVQVLMHFRWNQIYLGRLKLGSVCALKQEYSSKQLTRLLRPWCLTCATGPPCQAGTHAWQPPLFFTEIHRGRTYWRPNGSGWATLLPEMIQAAELRGKKAEKNRVTGRLNKQMAMAQARAQRW